MPVVDGVFAERTPMCLAERSVDFPALDEHVLDQRVKVEQAALPTLRRIGVLVEEFHGLMPSAVVEELAQRLRGALDRTARFGYRTAREEIRRLRAGRPDPVLAYAIPNAGEYADLAAGGLDAIRTLIQRRSREVAASVTEAVNKAAAEPGLDSTSRAIAIARAGQRALHNNVLELVGETLNMGRTAGAMAMPTPPEFAMRSEQLDKNTCPECDRVHGEIAQLGSNEYFQLLPPSFCLGGGRCRGVMVYGDGPVDLRMPLPEAA